jgi:spore germination protein PD
LNFTVYNYGLYVGNIEILGVASSSVFLIGDNETMQLSSMFDTPPESFIVGVNTNQTQQE